MAGTKKSWMVIAIIVFLISGGALILAQQNARAIGPNVGILIAILMPIMIVSGIAGIVLLARSDTRLDMKKVSASAPRQRLAVKIFSVYRTDRGKIVDALETELAAPGYHAVLVTPDGKRLQVETDLSVWQQCIEGSWGYAEVQGYWMGSYMRDAELYTKYSGR